ncbi:dTDP-3-amino-3,6-dideoxy-alpha-D-galactopyranose transaminase [mine drainage metagenome]|uniref:dTDP-3-amino-3,6-dideoxy-alpha-D-galactopyranose transaminase n=1 Tax=mine drainage metagenome TaxID=410659 RepID=A0A1J5SF01_9ZZZZ
MKSVPFFNYPFLFKSREDEFVNIFKEVGYRGAYILQKDLKEFEDALAKFAGTNYAIGLANGTDAIWLALMAAGIGEGDEVIFASHTYIATAAAIHFVGAIPVPADCKPDHMIDPESIKKLVTSKTKAILPTQLNGRCCDMDAIMKIAKEHDLIVLEDAAQGLGAKYKAKGVGSFDKGGTISFYPAKNLGSFGDAGGFVTNDKNMYEKVMLLRDHGRDENGVFVMWGFNSRLDNLQAAFLNYKLGYYDEEIVRRRKIAQMYHNKLHSIKQLHLPPAPNENPDYFDVYQNYEIEAERRDELKEFLKQNGVGTLIQWGGQPVHSITSLGFSGDGLPYTEEMFKKCLMIPMNTSLTDEDVDYVCEQINKFYK